MSHLTPIYDVWNGNAEAFAAAIGESGVTVRQWRNRGNIPPKYWPRIIDEAASRGVAIEWKQFVATEGGSSAPSPDQAAADQPSPQSSDIAA